MVSAQNNVSSFGPASTPCSRSNCECVGGKDNLKIYNGKAYSESHTKRFRNFIIHFRVLGIDIKLLLL